jgi:hypothetical protein
VAFLELSVFLGSSSLVRTGGGVFKRREGIVGILFKEFVSVVK